jgi:hypothetical protein
MSNHAGDTAIEAIDIAFDNTGTGLTATTIQDASVELDSRSVFLRKKKLEANFLVPADSFAVWARTMEIDSGYYLEIATGGTLEIL